MPTRDQVLQVPFVGGIDEYSDPDQLQPPSMAAIVNCVVRKTGRIEKREGFQYLQKVGVAGTPADTFSGNALSEKMEALGAYSGSDGSKLLLAADSKLYEYVGLDANHGYREVNRLPSCYGTLHPVDATGGEIIEVESMINDEGTLRCTVWVLGVRNGQDMTNDRATASQPMSTHGVYAAVQRVTDGSFVTPVVRITDSFGNDTTRCCDLRMTLSRAVTGSQRHWVVAFRRDYAVIEAFVVNSSDGDIKTTYVLETPFTGRPYVRAFDVTGVTGQAYMLLAMCDNDTQPASSDVRVRLVYFNATTGVFSTLYNMPGGVLNVCNATGSTTYSVRDWQRHTPRGVVLENNPLGSTVSIAIRTVYEMDSLPYYLDGKFVVTRANCSSSTIAITSDDFAWLHRAGFQTEDNFGLFSLGSQYQSKYSASPTSVGYRLIPTTYTPVASSLITVLTAQFLDGSVQTYAMALLANGTLATYQDPVLYTASATSAPTVSSYPRALHQYPADNSVSVTLPNSIVTTSVDIASIDQRNVTSVRLGGAPGVVGFANSTRYCRLSDGTGVRCLAVVSFNGAGIPYDVALYDGRGANVYAAPSLVDITQIETRANPYTGAWGAPVVVPAGTIRVYDDFNALAPITATDVVFEDIGLNSTPTQQTIVETSVGVEECVHRWDVVNTGGSVILAVSSVSAATFSSPNGDPALGCVSPFARSNYFEVYPWVPVSQTRWDMNDYGTTGSSTARPIWCALGGPWRMIGGLVKVADGRYGCVLTPAGDDFQRSAFLVSFVNGDASVQTELDPVDNNPIEYAGGVVYDNNSGVFVESMNMARVAAVPLNCPRFSTYTSPLAGMETLSVGAIRQGQTVGGTEVFAIDYSFLARQWRVMRQWGDYTVLNGGVVSAFDGSSCNEATMLLWPQRDLTSIAYDPEPTLIFSVQTTDAVSTDYKVSAYKLLGYGSTSYLSNVTRPWFAYEAGFRNKNESVSGGVYSFMYWSRITTEWGGDPQRDYQSVYADPRLMQFTGSRYNNGVGLNQLGASHYYGRYQSGYSVTLGTGSAILTTLWAPRTAPGDSSVLNNVYNPLVANGDFLVRWCYEAVDGTGRVVRSAPSQAVTFSVCCLASAGSGAAAVPGTTVDEYRYGFFAPRMELTNRLRTAASDPKRVVLQPYFTAEPFATVFYQVPFTNFLSEYKNDFTISRNATRGVVPYSSANAGLINENPYGLVTSNLSVFDGPQKDYNGLLSQPVLYTVGGGLDNVAPPSALCMTVHQNRLVLGGADDATVVWFSKELSPTDAPGFNDALTIQIEDGGPVTGLASMESLLVVFKRGMTVIIPGDMPDDTGGAVNRGYVSNTLGTPVRMPHGIGCIDHRAVVETPVGVFFQSQRTIELLSRDMSITPIGLKLDDTLTEYPEVTAAVHNPKDTEVWFALRKPTTTASVFVVYNYTTDVWSKHTTNLDSFQPVTFPMTIMDNIVYFATNWIDPLGVQPLQTVVYKQTDDKFFDVSPSGRRYVSMAWQTAPIALNQVQGYQRMKRIRVFGSPIPTLSTGAAQTRDPHGVSFTLQTDYATTGPNLGTQTAAWTEAEATAVYAAQNREVYEVHVAEQKGQKLTLSYVETAPANINTLTHGYGTAFSNMAFVVGLKSGIDKRITSGAKH
jgi:hypothetical protein